MPFRKDQKVELIKAVPLFAGLSKTELGRIAQLADEVQVDAGTELIAEGDRGRQFFVLITGGADVRRRGRKVNSMKGGDFFGEISLVSDRKTTASVRTTEPSRLLVVSAVDFRGLLNLSKVQLKVLRALAERVAD
jgi:CRP-like cAMP-binding protein